MEFLIGNIKGDKGDPGTSLKILGYYATVDELSAAITNPSIGDTYGVGSTHPYDIYVYSQNGDWVNNGSLQGAKGEKGDKGDKGDTGDTGEKGTDGTNATITEVTATVDETSGTPRVTVTMDGTESERKFSFSFSGLKGEKGEQGDKGDKGDTGANGENGVSIDINEQTPTYTEASTLSTLSSGEKLSIVFGKIKKAINDLMSHLANTTVHTNSAERTSWNSKAPGGHGLGDIAAGTNNVPYMKYASEGSGFYQVASADGSPHGMSEWTGLMQLVRSKKEGAETGAQLAFYDFNTQKPKMWLRTLLSGTAGPWVEMIHSGNIASFLPVEAAENAKIEFGSYVGTGSTESHQLTFYARPLVLFVLREGEDFPNVIVFEGDSYYGKVRAGNDTMGGFVSVSYTLKTMSTGFNHYIVSFLGTGQKWFYKTDPSTNKVSIDITTFLTDSDTDGLARHALNWEGSTYTYVAICEAD